MQPMTQRTGAVTWTVLSLLRWGTEHLSSRGFNEARLTVELLLARTLNLTRVQLYTNFDRPLDPEELASFKILFKRRLSHEPVQYILGETEFMGIPLLVDRRALIPRPETELLVEAAITSARETGLSNVKILDIGTGSGNIPIALARFLPEAAVTSVDVSSDALDLAQGNAQRHNISSIIFRCANILTESFRDRSFDVIVSNPPYIGLNEFLELQPEVREFEPRIATTDEADGLTFIRRIAELGRQCLAEHGTLLIEIAHSQAMAAGNIMEKLEYRDVCFLRDYAGIQRIVKAKL